MKLISTGLLEIEQRADCDDNENVNDLEDMKNIKVW